MNGRTRESLPWLVPLLVMAACSHLEARPAAEVDPDEVRIIGHRGAAGRAPENTIPSIEKALALQADAVEIDVRQTADERIVAMHDEDVDRTTDGSGAVGDLTLEEIRKLDAGSWFSPAYEDTRVPTLGEILDVVPESTTLIVEIKGGKSTYPGQIRRVVDILRERERKNVVLKSFALQDLRAFQRAAPEYPRLYVFVANSEWLPLVVDDGVRIGTVFDQDVQWLQKHRWFADRSFVHRAHRKGFRVVVWDVHEREDLVDAVEMGVDAIETDYPGRLHRLLEKWN